MDGEPAADGGDGNLRYTMNKETAGNVLSLLMLSGWSGRAELGLIGDDDLSLKVSPDGASWTTALSIDKKPGATTTQGGSVGAPGLAVDDAATGLYDAGGGYLGVAVSGANVVTFGCNNWLQVRRTGSASVTPAFAGESNVIFDFARYSDNASSPVLRMYKARGTTAAPAAVNEGDIGMELQAQAYGTSAFRGVLSTALLGRSGVAFQHGQEGADDAATRQRLRDHDRDPARRACDQPVDVRRQSGGRPGPPPPAPFLHGRHAALGLSRRADDLRVDGPSNRHIAVSDGTDSRFADGNVVS